MTTVARACLLIALVAGAACSGGAAAPSYTLLDDMEGTGNVIAWVPPGGVMPGGWWTATDCTQADRIAPLFTPGDSSTWSFDLLSAPHETFPGVTSQHAARLRTTAPLAGIWGATMGAAFTLAEPLDGGVDPSTPATGPGCRHLSPRDFPAATVDLSGYTGVTFWAMADPGGLRTLRVQIPDLNTDPRGGFCNAANPTSDDGCFNHFRTTIALTDTFTQYTINFATLEQAPNWGVRPDPSVPDLRHVYELSFQIDLPICHADETSMCAGGADGAHSFDFRIDDLYFVNRSP